MKNNNITKSRQKYSTIQEEKLPNELTILLKQQDSLRYGENPSQPAALYMVEGVEKNLQYHELKTGKNGMSGTNIEDFFRAVDILKYFQKPSVAIMKHLVPSGFATQYQGNSLEEIYLNARDADQRSAFGSAVVFNTPIDRPTADIINSTYVELVAAPSFEEGSFETISQRRNVRILEYSGIENLPKYQGDDFDNYEIKLISPGIIISQKPLLTRIKKKEDFILNPTIDTKTKGSITAEKIPTKNELDDLLTSWYVNLGTRSNGIVIVKNGTTLAIGSGQQERVGAVAQAITKAYQKELEKKQDGSFDGLGWNKMKELLGYNPLKEAVLSSDGFFPFRDSIDLISSQGITAIVQPFGSQRDYGVIEATNEHDLSIISSDERIFRHF